MPEAPPPTRLQEIRLEVPRTYWAAVKTGHRTEFRRGGRAPTVKFPSPTPTPATAYVRGRIAGDACLVVLEETWVERLGEISSESIEREGARDMADFRRMWCTAFKIRFRPLDAVRVYRVRPFTDEDREWAGALLLDRLYGRFL